ncbi:TPA: hypothetical protein N3E86_000758 [Salmonella enterica subsp. enterica serovar Tudu]|nr:hypothetical protein [Salmonella enterica subsp. enterica serovar Colorado]EBF9479487.1 hypothetical protein [Salmonella enterica subsp. enterica serovar Nigeria]EBW2326144.1 hypothetical protein [Salmonella enterica subsp. enterica serovar Agoueve]ECW0159717.1 hypothetical protein [Salmonella enterica subsp. enterica serovar Durham]EEL9954361.1 hypothetical protein [Salmonella enterica subsp. enterica serovar Aba]EFU6990041.1 hypothetical protein [Salmonella enterica subsp. enterica serova
MTWLPEYAWPSEGVIFRGIVPTDQSLLSGFKNYSGVYYVTPGNVSTPDNVGGVFFIAPQNVAIKLGWLIDTSGNLYTLANSKWHLMLKADDLDLGNVAYLDKKNKFTQPNTFDNYLISNLALRICAPNDKKLICDISGVYADLAYKTTFARIRSVSGNLVDGSYHFLVNSPNELILEDTSNKKKYTTYNTGNLTPVLSVNNNKPDANGDVKVSTGTTYSNSASKSTNGWFRDSSTGVIRQWGIGALNTTINFPMAFPTACTSIQVAILNSDPDDAMSVHDRTSTSFKPYNYWGNSGMSVIWGADGY